MVYVGQSKITQYFEDFETLQSFPRVVTISGRRGFGKSYTVEYFCDKFGICDKIVIESIDDVREVITNAPTLSHNTLVWVKSFESLNFRAKETLLKLCEDIPNFIYIIIEVTNLSLYEDRFLNRSQLLSLEPYSKDELKSIIYNINPNLDENTYIRLISMLGAPKDFKTILNLNQVEDVYNLVNKCIKHINKAQPFNSMKIFDSLSSKANDNKIDFILFFVALGNCSFREYYKTLDYSFFKLFLESTKCIDSIISCPRVNKRALFDTFILNIQE